LPLDRATNHLAVHTEDHPMEYAGFHGEIPHGEYGGGQMHIWDRGTYETEKWTDREVKVVLHGSRVTGRYVLFKTGGKNWMIHRMDPPAENFEPVPKLIRPMLPVVRSKLPTHEDRYSYEMSWDGVRAVVYVEGGRPRALSTDDDELTSRFPELRTLAENLGSQQVVLDGVLVVFDDGNRPSAELIADRMRATTPTVVRRLAQQIPATYVAFDVLHLEGRSTLALPFSERRALLESLQLNGSSWLTSPTWTADGKAVMTAAQEQGLAAIVAKELDSPYRPGRRSQSWIAVTTRRQTAAKGPEVKTQLQPTVTGSSSGRVST
jgi:bifunctional non-homologous end joining protein LigD